MAEFGASKENKACIHAINTINFIYLFAQLFKLGNESVSTIVKYLGNYFNK